MTDGLLWSFRGGWRDSKQRRVKAANDLEAMASVRLLVMTGAEPHDVQRVGIVEVMPLDPFPL
jgi:hypothetical protein